MAKMLPDVPLDQIKYGSERIVYEALQSQLPKAYTVLHSYPWLRPERAIYGHPLREGEADFVVLHPERGMLVLEIKGGELVLEDHCWYRQTSNGLQRIKDPFEQASRNKFALMDLVEKRSRIKRENWNLIYGTAVVFPQHNYAGQLPTNADRAIIVDRRDMDSMTKAIERAYASWTGAPRILSKSKYNLLLDVLLPKFKLVRPLAPDLEYANQQIYELTTEQQAAFKGLYENNRVLVKGAAGSGKTVLALQRALAYASEGKRCLFVCFNKELAIWLQEQVKSDPVYRSYADRIRIEHFHRLAYRLARQAKLPFSAPSDGERQQAFWDEEVPDILEQAATILSVTEDCRYDAIVVDEAQDFCEMWWYSLVHSFLEDPEESPLYAFYDPNQSLRETATPPPIEFGVYYNLTYNCRNTKHIAHTSAAFIELESHVLDKLPLGEKPILLRAGNRQEQRKSVMAQLTRLISRERLKPEQIVVIGPTIKNKGSLSSVYNVAGIPLVTSAEAWRRNEGILVTTTRSFKGLEADVVIVYDLWGIGERFTKMDLYVACTRARVLLVMIVYDEETELMIQQSIETG